MSRAQTYAKNVSRLLDRHGKAGRLSLAAMQLRLPPVVGVRYAHTGKRLAVGKDLLSGASGESYRERPACSRVVIEGDGRISATLTFFYRGYGDVTVRATGNGAIAFPVPLPDGWRYPEAAGRLTNMSRQGDFS